MEAVQSSGGSTHYGVLVVDDNPTNRLVLEGQLRRIDLAVHAVDCGLDAIHAFSNFRFCMVLMDCHMPGMDGFLVTREIRAIEKSMGLAETPVIAFTADDSHDIKERCLASGMNGYLRKPLSLDVLRKAVARWVPNHVAAA
ncbi:MAG: response regulator [Nitrosomonadales bacterium]|nr:MAG: response regulator [Nitrosomonadales bacterium]